MNEDINVGTQARDSYEMRITEFESLRSDAMEAYFAARPQLFRTREKECLFEAGFRMAWDVKNNTIT